MMENPVHLRLQSLTRHFGGLTATDDVSLEIPQGQLLAVVGPNGAGKSTLIQLITGFLRPDSGHIRFDGHDITGRKPEAIAALGVARTFQTSRVFPGLSVFDSVMVGVQAELLGGGRWPHRRGPFRELLDVLLHRRAYREQLRSLETRAEQVLQLFGERLWPHRDSPAFGLSYANRRRLEIARALVAEPRLLLLDEPTAGMNPTETAELTELIHQLHADRPDLTIVLVEHKLHVVRRLAHRVVVMNQGAVLVDETPEEALDDPRVIEAYLGKRAASGALLLEETNRA